MKNYLKNKNGSVALISILIISAIIVIIVVSMAEINFLTSKQQVNLISNKISYYGAEACLEESLVRLKNDSNFSEETINLNDEYTCQINVINDTININLVYLNYEKNYEAEFEIIQTNHINNIKLLNWKEI